MISIEKETGYKVTKDEQYGDFLEILNMFDVAKTIT